MEVFQVILFACTSSFYLECLEQKYEVPQEKKSVFVADFIITKNGTASAKTSIGFLPSRKAQYDYQLESQILSPVILALRPYLALRKNVL